MRRVVITGLGMVSPVGLSVKESWANIVNAKSGISQLTLFNTDGYAAKIAGEVRNFSAAGILDVKNAKRMSKFMQFAVVAAHEAILDSGIDLKGNTEKIGCSIGVGIGAIDEVQNSSIALHEGGPRKISPFFIPYVIANMAPGLVSNHFNLKGPNISTTTACASGTHAIGEAWLYMQNNMADAMVCGGSEAAICQISVAGFSNMKALSTRNHEPEKASRPFDRDRDGFVISEGAGILVLEDYEAAKKRGAHIYAEIVGYGMSGDAYHITAPAPEGEGARRCMAQALNSAKINPEAIDYINAHGTSTELNDLYETKAITNVFKDHAKKLAVSSIKGVTGHSLGAAGGIEAAIVAKSLSDQVAPPTANLENPDPECNLDYIPLVARDMKMTYALSNSFGFGGTNGCLVFKKV